MLWLILVFVAVLSVIYVLFRPTKRNLSVPALPSVQSAKLSPEAEQLKSRLGLCDNCKPVTLSYNMGGTCNEGELLALISAIQEITALYVLCEATSDEEEESFRRSLQGSVPVLAPQRVLFYSSAVGRMAIVRQVNPSVHIEHDLSFCEKLKPHVKKIVHVNASAKPTESTSLSTKGIAAESSGGVSECERTAAASSSCAAFPTVVSLRHVLEIQLE